MIELLAPSGGRDSFFAALNNGADAVYMGLNNFSARGSAENFKAENLLYYTSYAHALGVKVYVALNTVIKDKELSAFFDSVYDALSGGADALILQDVFLGKIIKEKYPDAELHLSTQAGVNNLSSAILAKESGFRRVILSRETDISDVAQIAKVIDTEIFVQGALCASFSGHCYLSSFIGGNSGNRGYCKQPCRQKYSFCGADMKCGDYPISLSDLSLIDKIKEIAAAGVKSVKIEGRMRSPEYVAATVKAYRAAIDGKNYDFSEVERTFNRGDYTHGYLFGKNRDIVSDKIQSHKGKTVAKIKDVKGNEIIPDVKIGFAEKDGFKIIRDGYEVASAVFMGGKLRYDGFPRRGDAINVTKDNLLSQKLLSAPKKLKEITIDCKFIPLKRAELACNGVTVYSAEPLQVAKNQPLTLKDLQANLNKTDVYPFKPSIGKSEIGSVFIAKSALNEMRSALYAKLFQQNVKQLKKQDINFDFNNFYESPQYDDIHLGGIKATNINQNDAYVLLPEDYLSVKKAEVDEIKKKCKDVYLFVPAFLPYKDEEILSGLANLFDGVYADGLSGIALGKKLDKKIIAGAGLNVFNAADVSALREMGIKDIVFSIETSDLQRNDATKGLYYFTRGGIRVMEYIFCPFGRTCNDCKYVKGATIIDETGHKFYFNRYKTGNECRFELYNGSALNLPKRDHNFIVDLFDETVTKTTTKGNSKRELT